MFLSKRNGIYYLWHEDGHGHRRKVSTHQRQKTAALAFLQSFRRAQPSGVENGSCSLTEYYSSLREYLVSTHQPATVEIYDKAWKHLRALVGDIKLSDLSPIIFDAYKIARLRAIRCLDISYQSDSKDGFVGQVCRTSYISIR